MATFSSIVASARDATKVSRACRAKMLSALVPSGRSCSVIAVTSLLASLAADWRSPSDAALRRSWMRLNSVGSLSVEASLIRLTKRCARAETSTAGPESGNCNNRSTSRASVRWSVSTRVTI